MGAQEWIAIGTWVYAGFTIAILIVLAVAGGVAKRQLRLMRRDSMRRLVKNLMEQWMTDKLVDSRDTLLRMMKKEVNESSNETTRAEFLKQKLNKLEEEGSDLIRHLLRIPHYFEMVSILIESDRDALKEVIRLFRETIIYYYQLYQPWINEKRQRENMENLYVEFEKLHKQACAERKK